MENEEQDNMSEETLAELAKERDTMAILLAMYRRQEKVVGEMEKRLAEMGVQLERLAKGFPAGDPDGHRIYHEALIQQIEARKEFWRKLTFELAKGGLIIFIGWAAVTLWQAAVTVKVPK